MFPSGSAFPLLNNAATTVRTATDGVAQTNTGVTALYLQQTPNMVQAALPSLGVQPSGSVGQVAQTPEGNVTVPVTPLIGASPGEGFYVGMGAVDDAATGSSTVEADWRTAVRSEATTAANRASPLGSAWSGFVRSMVAVSFAASSGTPAELAAKLPTEPFWTGSWRPSWPGSAYNDARMSVAAIRDLLARAEAAEAAEADTGGSSGGGWWGGGGADLLFGAGSGVSSAGDNHDMPSGDSADEILDSVTEDLPGGTVTDTEATPVGPLTPGSAQPTPPWVWVLGGAVALGVVGLGVAAMTRRKSST